jgi:hypothetical protein
MAVKAIPRHARPREGPAGAARLRAGRFPGIQHVGRAAPAEPPRREHADPLTSPVPVTQPPVLGDQMRRPMVWCEIPPCICRYHNPAALGEADTRARAIADGWRPDAVGRLACPACQQRSPNFWPSFPLVPYAPSAADHRRHSGHARAGVIGGALSAVTGWLGHRARQAMRWPLLVGALAARGNGWNAPPVRVAASPPGRYPARQPPARAIVPRHRATRRSGRREGRSVLELAPWVI